MISLPGGVLDFSVSSRAREQPTQALKRDGVPASGGTSKLVPFPIFADAVFPQVKAVPLRRVQAS